MTAPLYLLFAVLIVLYELHRMSRPDRFLDFLFFFNVWFAVIYGICPFLIEAFGPRFAEKAFDPALYANGSVEVFLVIVVGYLSVIGGYTLMRRGASYSFVPAVTPRTAHVLWLVMAMAGLGAFGLFLYRYGGWEFVIENTSRIRSAKVERDDLGAIARILTDFFNLAFWILIAVWVHDFATRNPRWRHLLPLAFLMFCVAMVMALTHGGRGALLQNFIAIYLFFVFWRRRLFLQWLVPGLAFGLIVIVFGKQVIVQTALNDPANLIPELAAAFQRYSPVNIAAAISTSFSHPYLSLRVAMEATAAIGYRWFQDIPLGVLFYLRLVGIQTPDTVSYMNTFLILGQRESNIPPGLIGFFWYSAALPGVVLGGLLFGYVGNLLDRLLRSAALSVIYAVPFYVYAGWAYGAFGFTGDLRVYVMRYAPLIIAVTIMLGLCLRRSGQKAVPFSARAPALTEKP